jgi:hypothetical protein
MIIPITDPTPKTGAEIQAALLAGFNNGYAQYPIDHPPVTSDLPTIHYTVELETLQNGQVNCKIHLDQPLSQSGKVLILEFGEASSSPGIPVLAVIADHYIEAGQTSTSYFQPYKSAMTVSMLNAIGYLPETENIILAYAANNQAKAIFIKS